LPDDTARTFVRECVGADFLETVPEGGDCYLLKHITHDWDDARGRQVLANIARVMAPAGRVLVVDMVVPSARVPHPSYFPDVTMMAQTVGGRERTEKSSPRCSPRRASSLRPAIRRRARCRWWKPVGPSRS
jgi:hypothetical protein